MGDKNITKLAYSRRVNTNRWKAFDELWELTANILWQGKPRERIEVLELGTPLMGMALLTGSRVGLEVNEDGSVTIEPL